VAAAQHGIVALRQLRRLGLSASAVRSRVAAGRLHPNHQSVYAVGHPLVSFDGRCMAAVLACEPDALASHRSAAALLGLHRSARANIDVTVRRRTGRTRPGIDVHRAGGLRASDVTSVDGIRCTTVARTLLDLADVLHRRALERACDQAEVLRLFDGRALEDVLSSAVGRRGAPVLRAILSDQARDPTLTRSELEERFLAVCARAGVPRPRVNAWIELDGGGVEVDFLWREQRLIVEADATSRAFERDRRRDQRLLMVGWRVIRCTWRQVTQGSDEVARTLRTLLSE
jgi:hypothetical protein